MTATVALDTLRAELRPIVTDARRTASRPGWCSVRVLLSPLTVNVVLHTAEDGEAGRFVAPGTPPMAEACAALVNGCLGKLPEGRARQVRAFAAHAPTALSLLTDADAQRVHVLLDPGGDADLIELGSLSDEVVH